MTLTIMRYNVAKEIFNQFPGYTRGVVIARDVSNGDSPDELLQMLRDSERSVRAELGGPNIAEHLNIAAWREAYRCFGARPSAFRSSVEAMARRVVRGDELPSVNRLVDIGNVISLRHLVSAGCHAIDVAIGDFELRPAAGEEQFVPLGGSEPENPLPGEIVLVEGDVVLTRRWTWRQGTHTLTGHGSTAVELNIDGLPPVTPDEIAEACGEAEELIVRFCGGRTKVQFLTKDNPSIVID
jgi:DNA/RNA-binding domain of Phe-tRNA-synthetase-like protein